MATFSNTGGYSGHLRLEAQVDVGDPGPNTTSVNVRLRVWVETDGWNISDDQSVSFSGWKSGSVNFFNNLSSGKKLVVDRNWSHSVGSSQVNRSFSASLHGNNATGSSPSVSVNWHVDKSPARAPEPPSWGSMSVRKIGGSKYNPTYRLEWGPSTDDGGSATEAFNVEVDNNTSFFESFIDAVQSERHRDTIQIDPGGSYAWRVRCRNSVGWGNYRTREFSIPYETPETPTFDSTSSVTQTSANLWWFNGETGGAPTFRSRVQIRTASDGNVFYDNDFFDEGRVRSTGVLSPGTQYQWRVQVMNAAGWSDWMSWSPTFRTEYSEPKNRPALQVLVIDPTTAKMTWTYSPASGEGTRTGYDYQVSTDNSFGTLFKSGTLPASAISIQIGGLTPTVQYYFRIRAKNDVGNGPWSGIKSLTPPQGIRVWNGTGWAAKDLYYWDGTEWSVPTAIRAWNGATWVDAS